MYVNIETERDTARLHSLTRKLLGWKSSGPPVRFEINGRSIIKPVEIANIQANFYQDKVAKIKANLPKVRNDPLRYLRSAFSKWTPGGGEDFIFAEENHENGSN